MFIFLLICKSSAESGIGILQYTNPGKYTVNPIDYECFDNIIVEMWSAGASGSW